MMAHATRVKFIRLEKYWVDKVKENDISQDFRTRAIKFISKANGLYHIEVYGKKDTFIKHNHVNTQDEVIEIKLKLISPGVGKWWFFEILHLSRNKEEIYKLQKSMGKK